MKISQCSSCQNTQPAQTDAARFQRRQRTDHQAAGGGAGAASGADGASAGLTGAIVRPQASAQAAVVRQSSTRSAEITITTAEGDKVTLSLAARSEQTQSAYQAQGQSAAGQPQSIRGSDSSSQSATKVKVGIDGNLNDKEVADIKKLIAAFGQLTQGDASGVAQFGSLDSLSSAKFAYSSSSQTSYGAVNLYG